jgi:hypothetical protein
MITPDRKKPGVAFWATVVVVVGPLLYLLSIGPIIGILIRLPLPLANRAISSFSHTYCVPADAVLSKLPNSVTRPYYEYLYLFR